MKTIPLTQNFEAIVDENKYELLNKFKWCVCKCGGKYYAQANVHGKNIRMHSFLMGTVKGETVDHKNNDGLDNRIQNLRKLSNVQNLRSAQKQRKNKTSAFRGVAWFPLRGKWRARIKFNYKCIHIGLFDFERDAAIAWNKKAKDLGFSEEALNAVL